MIFMQFIVGFIVFLSVVCQGVDIPFDQDVAFKGLFKNTDSTINIPSWEKLPFDSISNLKDHLLHIIGSDGEKDCFLAIDENARLYGTHKVPLTKEDKLALKKPYGDWSALHYSFPKDSRLLASYTSKYDFFVVTGNNILGVQMSHQKLQCGKVIDASPLLPQDNSWGSIQAVTSSETHVWISLLEKNQPVVVQVNIMTGKIENTIALTGSTTDAAPTAAYAMYYAASWNKLFVSTDLAFYTVSFTDKDCGAYTIDHEWITGVLDTAPTAFAFDIEHDALWLAESNAIHKLDNTGRYWRYGYHQGSPFGDITSVTVANGYVYAASSTAGMARMRTSGGGAQTDTLQDNMRTVLLSGESAEDTIQEAAQDPWKWHYFGGHRYLPDNQVQQLVSYTSSHELSSMVIAVTATGLAYLHTAPWTLEEKAMTYASLQSPRHDRHKLTANCGFDRYGDPTSFYKESTDNDGLWTAMHAVGEAYAYATTGDESIRQVAWRAFEGLEMLVIAPGAYPRFPARSYCYLADGDRGCGDGGIWNMSTTVEGVIFKSDTSSDEIDGHLTALPVLYDLVAQTDDDKTRVYTLIDGITRGLVDNDLYLIDPLTNQPTKWGFWNPKEVNGNPKHYSERGMNSLQMLAYLASAYSITRDPLYKTTFTKLVEEHGYVKNMMNVKIDNPDDDNHSDNELMMLAYHTLFYAWQRISIDKEPAFKNELSEMITLAIPSLERAWLLIGAEFSPLWTGIYAGVAQQPASTQVIQRSIWTLRHWALDLIDWKIDDSVRWDVNLQPFFVRDSTNEIIRQIRPPSERLSSHWNTDPFAQKTGSGYGEYEPAVWRLPYYLMKYYKLI